jgi:hypothetical protein
MIYTPVPLHALATPANELNRKGLIMSTEELPQSIDPTVTAPMADTEPQTAAGKVLWHFTMSLDGFVAGPNHEMDWMTGTSFRPVLSKSTSKPLARCWEVGMARCLSRRQLDPRRRLARAGVRPHPPSRRQQPANGVTFLSCDVAEAARIGLEAAAGKNLEVFSPTIGRQLLERGLIDEIDLHIAPVLLGVGIRLLDKPGGAPIRVELLNSKDPTAAVNLRYHPVATQ